VCFGVRESIINRRQLLRPATLGITRVTVSDEPKLVLVDKPNPEYDPEYNRSRRHTVDKYIKVPEIAHDSEAYGWRLGNLSTHQDVAVPTNLKSTFLYHHMDSVDSRTFEEIKTEAAIVLIRPLSSLLCGTGGHRV